MGVSLSIRDVPETLAQRLRERAKRNHRSQQGELVAILEEALNPRLTLEEAHREIRRLNFSTPDESTQWIRESRDAGYSS